MKDKLNELRKDLFIEISSWGGLGPMPGNSGTIITKDNKLYRYHEYYRIPEYMQDKVTKEGLTEGTQLSEETVEKLKNYIEKNLIGKDFPDQMIFDASFHVTVNYNGHTITINNYPEINGDINNILKK